MNKALAVAKKEFWQIVRDARTLLILLFMPAFFLLLYGYALNWDIHHVRFAVIDRDHSTASRELISALINSTYFDKVADATSMADVERLMDQGLIRVVLVVPENLERNLRGGRNATVQVIINGDNANTATTVMGYAQAAIRGVAANLQVEMSGRTGLAPPITASPRIWFNPELKSSLFLVPGLIAFIVMITGVVSTALSIVREKERGTWEQVRMAPIDTVSYVVGKTIPYFVISFAAELFIIFAAMTLFGMPMRGSWPGLVMALSLYVIASLATGLLVSTLVDSQALAFLISILLSLLPTLILSGFIFPIASMPAAIQVVTYIVPARYFLIILRGIVLKGAHLTSFIPQFQALVIYAVLTLGLASLRLARERG
jgi:ABC-2 type transport system permease protein